MTTMTRKDFLKSAAAVMGGGLALSALGCGGPALTCGGAIALNHGHTLTVPGADAQAGTEKTYHIQGSGDHDHTVTITAAQFADLRAGTQVVITSSLDEGFTHDHEVTVTCS